MGPASGIYYIKNLTTDYYLAGTGTSGNIVPTSKSQPARFIVTEMSGMYSITLQGGSGLSVGLAPPAGAGDSLRWQRSPYQWNITANSAGVWNIRVPAEALYWFDTMKQGLNVVVKPDSSADENNWVFTAA